MKLRKGHLYIIVTLCFVISFVAINCKYDRFYRVNGINNVSEDVDYITRVIGYAKRISKYSEARQKEAAKRYYGKA